MTNLRPFSFIRLKFLLYRLKHETAEVRKKAADRLGNLGDPRALPALLLATEDRSSVRLVGFSTTVGRTAWWAIGKLCNPTITQYLNENKAQEILKKLLDYVDRERVYDLRLHAIDCLKNCGDVSVPVIEDYLLRTYGSMDEKLVDGLSGIDTQCAEDALVNIALHSFSDTAKFAAMRKLSPATVRRSISHLTEALNSSDKITRISAIVGLANYDGALPDSTLLTIDSTVLSLFTDSSQKIRSSLADNLKKAGWSPGSLEKQAAYYAALCDWDFMKPLEAMGVKYLIGSLDVDECKVRESALETLESMNWIPKTPSEKALSLVAKKEFKKAAQIGDDAMKPLGTALLGYWPKGQAEPKFEKEILKAIENISSVEGIPLLIEYLSRKSRDGDLIWLSRDAIKILNDLVQRFAKDAPDTMLQELVNLSPLHLYSDVSDYHAPEGGEDIFAFVGTIASEELEKRNCVEVKDKGINQPNLKSPNA